MHEKTRQYYGRTVPLALLLSTICGAQRQAGTLFLCMALTSLLTLAAPEMLRRSAARTISPRKLTGSLLLGGLITLAGAGIAQLLAPILAPLLSTEVVELRWWMGVAGLLALTALHCEYLFAVGEAMMAKVSGLLTASGLLGSTVLAGTLGTPPHQSALIITGIFLAIAVLESARSYTSPEIRPAMLRELPAALLRALIYPAAAAALLALTHPSERVGLIALFGGWTLFQRCRTVLRRDDRESAPFNVQLTLFSLLAGAVPALELLLHNSTNSIIFIVMLQLAAGLGMVIYGSADSAIGGCTLLLSAVLAALTQRFGTLLFSDRGSMLVAAALLCALPLAAIFAVRGSFTDLRNQSRARRIRRRAARRTRQ